MGFQVANRIGKAETWMKPLIHGQETGLVEIPASWYIDDLPPMMFIKKAVVSWCRVPILRASPANGSNSLELTRMGKPKRCHGYLEGPF